MRKSFLIPSVLIVLMFGLLVCQPVLAQDTNKGKGFNHADISLLKGPFNSAQEVTEKCITCHKKEAEDFVKTVHWTWMGPSPNFKGHERETDNGKVNLINNFCVTIESNWARCTQCHAGYGWIETLIFPIQRASTVSSAMNKAGNTRKTRRQRVCR